MKKLFTFIIGAAGILGATAQDFESDGLYYSVLSTDDGAKKCAVTGIVEQDRSSWTSFTIPSSVVYEGEEYTVTEVGDDA